MRRGRKLGWGLLALSMVSVIWIASTGSIKAVEDPARPGGCDYENSSFSSLTPGGYTGTATDVYFSDALTEIPANYFANKPITSAHLSSAISTAIGESAFSGCTALSTVDLGACTSIGANAFSGCTGLTAFTTSGSNPKFTTDAQGCLYEINGGNLTLLIVPDTKAQVILPNSTNSIAAGAMNSNCKNVVIDPGNPSMVSLTSHIQTNYPGVTVNGELPTGDPTPVNPGGGGGGGSGGGTDPTGTTTFKFTVNHIYYTSDGNTKTNVDPEEYDKAPGTYTINARTPAGYTAQAPATLTVTVNADGTTDPTADRIFFNYYADASNPAGHTHTYDTSKWISNEYYHWHASTCGCVNEIADKASHNYGDWYTVTEPTENQAGVKVRKCGTCGWEERKETTVTKYTVNKDGTVNKTGTKTTTKNTSTPKTADGFDTRYLLSLGIFLGGVGALFFSRQKKYSILSEGNRNK